MTKMKSTIRGKKGRILRDHLQTNIPASYLKKKKSSNVSMEILEFGYHGDHLTSEGSIKNY